jgi:hypothetical protein
MYVHLIGPNRTVFLSSHIDSKNTLHIGDLLLRFFDQGFFVNRLHLSLVSRLGDFDYFYLFTKISGKMTSLSNVSHSADSILISSNVKRFCCFQLSGGLNVHNIHFLVCPFRRDRFEFLTYHGLHEDCFICFSCLRHRQNILHQRYL